MSAEPIPTNTLSPQEKRELLERLLREKAAQGSAKADAEPSAHIKRGSIPRADRSRKYFPLSSAQQRIWLLDQLQPGNPVYNISFMVRLKGELNEHALDHSLSEIQKRHEILNVNFTVRDGEPVQFLVPDRRISLTIIDPGGDTGALRLARAEALAEEDAQRAFDLAEDALYRVNLFRLDTGDHLFQFVIHHSIFDGWSFNLLIHEIAFFYASYIRNDGADLPPLPIQYIDFAAWENTQLSEEFVNDHLEYWKHQLAGDLPVLEMPIDKPRPEIQSFRAGEEHLDLSPALTRSLNALSRQEGVTLFVTLLSAFYALLARYSGQEDIIVGTPIARRTHADVEKLIGIFINNLALRTDLSGNITFRELMKRVRRTALDAFSHQDLPFEKLLNRLRIERNTRHSPVFQVFFNLLDVRKGVELELPDVTSETHSLPEIGSSFDITLYAQNWGDELKINLVYNSDLFHSHSMAEFLERYVHLLERIVEDVEQQALIPSLPGRTRQKQQAILMQLARANNEFSPFTQADTDQSITSRFEQQVEKFPARTAVMTKRNQWTYDQLNRAANRTAHAILNHCPPGHDRIALLFDHDAPMLAGILGALKAGKTYIPLDPYYPRERLAYMLADSQSSAIITEKDQLDLARQLAGTGFPLINIGELPPEESLSNPRLDIPPDRLAYILYTSGSTGQPKGVMQSHRNILHFIKVYTNNLHIGAMDRLSLVSSYSFDAAVMDIFGALLNGAALYPIDIRNTGLLDLGKVLNDSQISIYHSTPTVYRYFLNSLDASASFPFIRLIVLGGEAVFKPDIELFKARFTENCILINGFGPTESTVSLQYFVDRDTDIIRHAVPVGYPVDGTEIILLNEAGQEVHLVGEIAIRSKYVALGYWQKPDVTESAFDAAPRENGKRTYRTGDLGCLLPDGTIEFRGRRDFQVKIRGHRVELGEVETRLAEHPMIKECAIIPVDGANGDTFLAAYYVPMGTRLVEGELRNFLQGILPVYMIPTLFISLESLPLTPTGKIDRKALPAPDRTRIETADAYAAPRDEVERFVTNIFSTILQSEQVGIRDSFFERGGHSLLATRVLSRINDKFAVQISLRSFFMAPTVEGLSDTIKTMLWAIQNDSGTSGSTTGDREEVEI